jgi:outer membrane protein assembly factor BamB
VAASVLGVSVAAGLAGATVQVAPNWSAFLFGPAHGSTNAAATAITPANAAGVSVVWKWRPDPATMPGQSGNGLYASPTVVNGRIYIGANTGVMYALDENTGAVVWQRFLGFVPTLTCGARGLLSTATVATDPVNGRRMVYVYSPDGYLYALTASTGDVVWKSVVAIPSTVANDYFAWSSPTVFGGHVYVGFAGYCGEPPVRGGAKVFDQTTGALQATFWSVPDDQTGGGAWSSLAVDAGTGSVFMTSANSTIGNHAWITRLDGQTLALQDSWVVPHTETTPDSDFGASPVLFRGTVDGTPMPLVGACNKNGIFYAWQRQNLAVGPVWRFREGNPDADGTSQCNAAAVWDGSHLFVAGGSATTVDGVDYPGAIRSLDPSTGVPVWETGLPGHVLGTPTLDGSGVLAVASWNSTEDSRDGVAESWLVDASNGRILATLPTRSSAFAQPVFADQYLFVATTRSGLYALAPIVPVTVGDGGFMPASVTPSEGGTVQWSFDPASSHAHDVADGSGMGLFDSGPVAPGGAAYSYTFSAAGVYPVVDATDGQSATASVAAQAIPSSGTTTDTFTVRLASAPAPAGFKLTVQVRRPGSTAFATLATTQAASVSFTPDAGPGTYGFRVHLRKSVDGTHSDWSPAAVISVS